LKDLSGAAKCGADRGAVMDLQAIQELLKKQKLVESVIRS
jgi:hypothetical protein